MKPSIILCDIDGTVADCTHRLHHIDDTIRQGDTVYLRGMPNSKANPLKVLVDEGGGVFGIGPSFDGGVWKIVADDQLRKKKQWRRFFEECENDLPLQTTRMIINTLRERYPVAYLSGRPDTYKMVTLKWLNDNGMGLGDGRAALIMRPADDKRPDHEVKRDLYLQHIEPYYNVLCVFDDRKRVVDMWRSLGLQVYQVAEGNF